MLHHFVITQLEHKCKAKLKGAHVRESKRVSKDWGDVTPIERRVLLTRHFDNSLSVYLFLEFQSQTNQRNSIIKDWKENKAFRFPFITKKQIKIRQALHRILLKLEYKVQRGASILYFNASFSDVPSFSKMLQPQVRSNKWY